MNEELQKQIASLDDAGLAELQAFIKERRAELVEARNAALPEFPVVIAVQGHQAPVQVTRAKCIELLTAGTHTLA